MKKIAEQIVRQLDAGLPAETKDRRWLETAVRVLNQKRKDGDKIYSLHEPEVYCMSKGIRSISLEQKPRWWSEKNNGVFLILIGIKVLLAPEKPVEPEKNPILKLLKKFIPLSPRLEGQRFFTHHNGVRMATPLFVALVLVEISDIIFAVDSVPAIFAITKEPLIVFTSNIFAILGLRAMFFLLAGVVHKFRFLKYGLGLVLVFVGLKMVWLNQLYGGHFPIGWSLAIISTLIGGSIAVSFMIPSKKHP